MGKALFRTQYQRGLFTIFRSNGSNPLKLWDLHLKNGYIKRYIDPQLKSMIFEICGNNVSTSYMVCPKGDNELGIAMPYFVMVVKNLHKYWSFEITIKDDENVRRRFRVSNFQSSTQINQLNTAMPIALADEWNQIQFNLADFTNRAYARHFCEVVKIKVNANIAIRRIYFAERLIPDNELPMEYKLYLPISGKPNKLLNKGADVENVPYSTAPEEMPQAMATDEPVKITSDAKLEESKQSVPLKGPSSSKQSTRGENANDTKLEGKTQKSQSKGSVHSKMSTRIENTEAETSHSNRGSEVTLSEQKKGSSSNEPANSKVSMRGENANDAKLEEKNQKSQSKGSVHSKMSSRIENTEAEPSPSNRGSEVTLLEQKKRITSKGSVSSKGTLRDENANSEASTSKKGSDDKLEDRKQPSQSKGSMTSKVSVLTLLTPRVAKTQPGVMSPIITTESKYEEVGFKISKRFGSKTASDLVDELENFGAGPSDLGGREYENKFRNISLKQQPSPWLQAVPEEN